MGSRTAVVLLPGLDGTGRLFKRFIAAAPPHVAPEPVALPQEPLEYTELAGRIAGAIAACGSPVLIAESFSGPLAVLLAERCRLAGIIFCNSFVSAPRSRALRWLALPPLLRRRAPHFLLRRYLVGARAGNDLVQEVADAIAAVPAPVLASRIRSVLAVDESGSFARSTVPALYLRGSDDRSVPDASCRHMAALRQIHIARLPGPHLLLQGNPVAAWQAIQAFLDGYVTTTAQ